MDKSEIKKIVEMTMDELEHRKAEEHKKAEELERQCAEKENIWRLGVCVGVALGIFFFKKNDE